MSVKKFAFIRTGIVQIIKDREEDDLPAGQDWRLIEGLDPLPAVGWTANTDGSYSPPATINYLYAHIAMTGGDELDPPGIEMVTGDDLTISIAVRLGADPASTLVSVFSGKWRIAIRTSDGNIYDIVGTTFTAGEAVAVYTVVRAAKLGPAVCRILESDLIPVSVGPTEYHFKLIGDTEFKVYEDA